MRCEGERVEVLHDVCEGERVEMMHDVRMGG